MYMGEAPPRVTEIPPPVNRALRVPQHQGNLQTPKISSMQVTFRFYFFLLLTKMGTREIR